MARQTKHGNNKNGPSHLRYVSRDRRTVNKERRIAKCNGAKFLAAWKKELPAWKIKHAPKAA